MGIKFKVLDRLLKGREPEAAHELELSETFCHCLTILCEMFGQGHWDGYVVDQLKPSLASGNAPKGAVFERILTKLFSEVEARRSDLHGQFLPGQQSLQLLIGKRHMGDKDQYRITIRSAQEPDHVLVVWQLRISGLGSVSIQFLVSPRGWAFVDEKLDPNAAAQLERVGKAGGDVLGYLVLTKLVPENTQIAKAVLAAEQADMARWNWANEVELEAETVTES